MKNNRVAFIGFVAFLFLGACQKEDDSSIQLAGTTWCAKYSDNKHNYQHQLEFLKSKRIKTRMFGTIRPDAPTDEWIPHEVGGIGELIYEVLPQPTDASDVMLVISDPESGFSDHMSYYRQTSNDGPARIVQGERIYYQGGCSF
ncbi:MULTISPECIES: hypothetical protein [Sphingobacterium]|uniref:Lipoprotein n=1 Tax=Sphingobacterium populi TaxID=1812824 RepID=A0ABW5UDU6_9SPHI|nr:hypothetical protein [Sphingobacterium sp. CFCC 11742]